MAVLAINEDKEEDEGTDEEEKGYNKEAKRIPQCHYDGNIHLSCLKECPMRNIHSCEVKSNNRNRFLYYFLTYNCVISCF